jgi:hypothetical protein
MIGEITASQIKTKDSMRKSITWVIQNVKFDFHFLPKNLTFINWNGVGDTISGVQDNTGGSS